MQGTKLGVHIHALPKTSVLSLTLQTHGETDQPGSSLQRTWAKGPSLIPPSSAAGPHGDFLSVC
jgi:hypothetical protein